MDVIDNVRQYMYVNSMSNLSEIKNLFFRFNVKAVKNNYFLG